MRRILVALLMLASIGFSCDLEKWQTCMINQHTKVLKKVGDHFVIVDETLATHEKQINHNHEEIHNNEKTIFQNKQDIFETKNKVRINSTQIEQNVEKLQNHEKEIANTDKALRYTQKTVLKNSQKIEHNHKEIHANEAKIEETTELVNKNTQVNTEQQKAISKNTKKVNSIENKMTAYSDEVAYVKNQVDENKENLKDLEFAMLALSAVDFNPDHEGLSLGFGFSSTGSDSVAGAIGVQYGMGYVDGVSVAVNAKGYVGEGLHHKGVGVGMTLGF